MTTRLADKANVNAMVKAIEVSAKANNVVLTIDKTSDTVKVTLKDKVIYRALKTNGPWLVTYEKDLF